MYPTALIFCAYDMNGNLLICFPINSHSKYLYLKSINVGLHTIYISKLVNYGYLQIHIRFIVHLVKTAAT